MPNSVDYSQVSLTGGYLHDKQQLIKNVTIPAILKSYTDTGRVRSFKLNWRRGEPGEPHIFWDSDIAKWIESVSYTLAHERDPVLESVVDGIVDDLCAGQTPDGYFNVRYLTTGRADRFTNRHDHELYCAGHLIEAAVAYYNATGKRAFLDAMCRYADHIEAVFKDGERPESFQTPGHEEIELALVKLYQAIGDRRYLDLARFFIDKRGVSEAEKESNAGWFNSTYAQDHLPPREQRTAEGHAVRELYLLCGMADIARECGDGELQTACEAVFDNITQKRMYITGGLGGNYVGESFSYDYDLPNETAYAETCASIAMAFFCHHMFLLTGGTKYIDALELMLYNAVPAGLSASGDRFFYTNPLEAHPERREYHSKIKNGKYSPETERPIDFQCSCCPPNAARFFASVGGMMYGTDENRVYVNLYGSSVYESGGVRIEQQTDYPWDGTITLSVKSDKPVTLCLRIPGWCDSYEIDGSGYTVQNGYAVLEQVGTQTITLRLSMPVREVYANPRAHYNAGRIAVRRGSIVYCAEGADNGDFVKSAVIKSDGCYTHCYEKDLLGGIVTIECDASIPVDETEALYQTEAFNREDRRLKLIPYAAWANRGKNEMSVWLLKEAKL